MTRKTILRHAPLLCVLAWPLLTGFSLNRPHYEWRLAWEPAKTHVWHKVSFQETEIICQRPVPKGGYLACMKWPFVDGVCNIYSFVTEEQARYIYEGDGLSIYEHEVKHCQGWDHQKYDPNQGINDAKAFFTRIFASSLFTNEPKPLD